MLPVSFEEGVNHSFSQDRMRLTSPLPSSPATRLGLETAGCHRAQDRDIYDICNNLGGILVLSDPYHWKGEFFDVLK